MVLGYHVSPGYLLISVLISYDMIGQAMMYEGQITILCREPNSRCVVTVVLYNSDSLQSSVSQLSGLNLTGESGPAKLLRFFSWQIGNAGQLAS